MSARHVAARRTDGETLDVIVPSGLAGGLVRRRRADRTSSAFLDRHSKSPLIPSRAREAVAFPDFAAREPHARVVALRLGRDAMSRTFTADMAAPRRGARRPVGDAALRPPALHSTHVHVRPRARAACRAHSPDPAVERVDERRRAQRVAHLVVCSAMSATARTRARHLSRPLYPFSQARPPRSPADRPPRPSWRRR